LEREEINERLRLMEPNFGPSLDDDSDSPSSQSSEKSDMDDDRVIPLPNVSANILTEENIEQLIHKNVPPDNDLIFLEMLLLKYDLLF